MKKHIIVAISDNNAIGKGGQLPWHISADLKYFKSVTLGCPVIMGRKTFESLGRPLPGRKNIVISRQELNIEGVELVHSLTEAYELCADAPQCFVIGGAQIYKEAINTVDSLYITKVHTIIDDADAFFPEIDSSLWTESSRSELLFESGHHFEFIHYIQPPRGY